MRMALRPRGLGQHTPTAPTPMITNHGHHRCLKSSPPTCPTSKSLLSAATTKTTILTAPVSYAVHPTASAPSHSKPSTLTPMKAVTPLIPNTSTTTIPPTGASTVVLPILAAQGLILHIRVAAKERGNEKESGTGSGTAITIAP